MTTTDLAADNRTWSRLERVTGAGGLLAIVLIFGSVITIGEGEPPPLGTVDAPATPLIAPILPLADASADRVREQAHPGQFGF
jgi:hypothetical protein